MATTTQNNEEFNLEEYRKGISESRFLNNALILFEKSGLFEHDYKKEFPHKGDLWICMDKYKEFKQLKNSKKEIPDEMLSDLNHKIKLYFEGKVSSIPGQIEFHLLIVRLAIALELSLKGIALYKGFNIFKLKKRGVIN